MRFFAPTASEDRRRFEVEYPNELWQSDCMHEPRVEVDGKTSPLVGAGMIFPQSDRVTFVAELTFEGERFEGADSDVRVLGGLNWRLHNRGMVRGAVAFGLTDGAPDLQLIGGYAWTF